MGELSKKIGEIGENIASNFFDLIGWGNALPNESLKCLKPQKHAKNNSKNNKRETHGIDFLFNYKTPLESNTVNNIIISIKNSDAVYPNNPVSKFKDFIEDLAHTTECFNRSPLKSEQLKKYRGYQRTNDIGVLFWLSHNENTYHDVVQKLESCQIDKELNFDTIYVVDNKRVEFIFKVISFLKLQYPNHNRYFYYPKTSLNYSDTEITQFGICLPVEYINSPVIPFLLKQGNSDIDTFCIAVSDNFDKEELPSLIQAARDYTNEITCNYLFLFPNYVQAHHHQDVLNAASTFEYNSKNNIEVASFNPDYRSLNNA